MCHVINSLITRVLPFFHLYKWTQSVAVKQVSVSDLSHYIP